MPVKYVIKLPDPERARGSDPNFSFTAHGAEGFAEQLQAALRTPALYDRWRNAQPDPDEVDPMLGATDPDAVVTGQQYDLSIDLVASTRVSGDILKHRMRLLAGSGWELRDVR